LPGSDSDLVLGAISLTGGCPADPLHDPRVHHELLRLHRWSSTIAINEASECLQIFRLLLAGLLRVRIIAATVSEAKLGRKCAALFINVFIVANAFRAHRASPVQGFTRQVLLSIVLLLLQLLKSSSFVLGGI